MQKWRWQRVRTRWGLILGGPQAYLSRKVARIASLAGRALPSGGGGKCYAPGALRHAPIRLLRSGAISMAMKLQKIVRVPDSQCGFERFVKGEESLQAALGYETPYLLLDAWSNAAYGGTGLRLDWELVSGFVSAQPAKHRDPGWRTSTRKHPGSHSDRSPLCGRCCQRRREQSWPEVSATSGRVLESGSVCLRGRRESCRLRLASAASTACILRR